MTVKELIQELLDSAESLDDDVKICVCAQTDTIKEYMKMAEKDNNEWCLDEILRIEEFEDRGGHIWIHAEEIV